MSTDSRRDLLAALGPLYQESSRSEKTKLLENFIVSTGYSRKHAITLLKGSFRRAGANQRGRKPLLGDEARGALVFIWETCNRICGKRLVPFIPQVSADLERFGHLVLSGQAKKELLQVSAATVDRLLRTERDKVQKSLSFTKRAALVKSKVPVRTFTEWNDVKPGFFEIDTVSHSSSDGSGHFLSSLNMTDIATCWTVPMALYRKSSTDVIGALERAAEILPFPILGLDFDNGTEFLNTALIDWCDLRQITYTRSREYKKNDQAWIEEKNGSVIRRSVGRERYEGDASWKTLSKLYSVLSLYFNFFQPCQKLLFKHRQGAKTYKKHDVAQTPYARVLANPHISAEAKAVLKHRRDELDILQLVTELKRLQTELRNLAVDIPNPVLAAALAQRNATHQFITRHETKLTHRPPRQDGRSEAIREIIRTFTPGMTIKAQNLSHIAQRSAIDSCLTRLNNKGFIRRIARGIYQVPFQSPLHSYPKIEAAGSNNFEAMI